MGNIIYVSVKLNKNNELVEHIGGNTYIVWTKKTAKENKANIDIIEQLSKFFDVPKLSVILKSGNKSRKKIFEILI